MQPFRYELFRILWLTAAASQVATWMQNTAAGWQMTLLTDAALPVALLQTATSLPFLLVGLPSGALADVAERRIVLVASHTWLALCAALLALLSATGAAAPWMLLALTLAIGFGTAVNNPALLAAMSDAVPRSSLAAATTLTSAAINAARAVGPPLAGVLVALADPAAAYAVVAAAFAIVAAVAARLSLPKPKARRHSVDFGTLLADPTFRIVLARTALFITGASALWALLPLVAARHFGLGSGGFGVLLGLLGTGAVTAAVLLGFLRPRASVEAVTVGGTALFAVAMAGLAAGTNPLIGAGLMLLLGVAWLSTRSTLTVAAQITVDPGARGRAFAAQMLIWHGGQALGGIGWALAADRLGLRATLAACGMLLGASLLAVRFLPLPPDDAG